MKRFILGAAGFIGSGKSTVCRYFQKFGALCIDADKVVDILYGPQEEGFQKVYSFFGDEYLTRGGLLNRKKISKIVFGDPKKLKILQSLIHPLVTAKIQKMIDQSKAPFVVLEATYFERKSLWKLVSAILWIDTKKELAFERLARSRHVSREMFEKIYRLQVRPEKIDYMISNNGSLPILKQKVADLFKKLR